MVRRWVAALLLVPEQERRAVVEGVEARVASAYARGAGGSLASDPGTTEHAPPGTGMLFVRSEPRLADGYVEQVERAYEPANGPRAAAKGTGSRARSAPGKGRA